MVLNVSVLRPPQRERFPVKRRALFCAIFMDKALTLSTVAFSVYHD